MRPIDQKSASQSYSEKETVDRGRQRKKKRMKRGEKEAAERVCKMIKKAQRGHEQRGENEGEVERNSCTKSTQPHSWRTFRYRERGGG